MPTSEVVLHGHGEHGADCCVRALMLVLHIAASTPPDACRFTHDAIRVRDKVYACNTDGGAILELQYPSMEVLRTFELFSAKEHINTLAAVDDDSLWVVLHNLGRVRVLALRALATKQLLCPLLRMNNQKPGRNAMLHASSTQTAVCAQSLLAQVDLKSGTILRRIRDVGVNSHGLVAWRGVFVSLSSKETSLVTIDPVSEAVDVIWQVLVCQQLATACVHCGCMCTFPSEDCALCGPCPASHERRWTAAAASGQF